MPATTVYQVTIGQRTIRVALRQTADGVVAQIDDGPHLPVHMATVHGTLRALAIDDRRLEALAAPMTDGSMGVVINGVEYRAEVVDEAHARLASVAGSHHGAHARFELKAPMPGLVVRLECAVGDDVVAGQPLAVLQAMKMENELAAPRPGRVASVAVAAGQTVEQGQVLLTVE